jgi:hypothetical protein
MSDSNLHYRLTNDEWVQAVQDLKPAQRDVLYYLRTLDPFGDRSVDIGVREIARTLGYDASTVSRALKVLDQKGYIDLELLQVRVKVKACGKVLFPDNTVVSTQQNGPEVCGKVLFPDNTVVSTQQSRSSGNTPISLQEPENLQDRQFKNKPCTNNKSNYLNKEQLVQARPTTHPVPENEQEGLGTIFEMISRAGIQQNKTIQRAVDTAIQREGPAAAAVRVRNALSAVKEQQELGNCRNPGGMLVAALRKGFTANELKGGKDPIPTPTPPNLNLIAIAIDRAMLMGDRAFGLTRLQDLWAEGWRQEIEDLCRLRRDWGFQVTANGVIAKEPIAHD